MPARRASGTPGTVMSAALPSRWRRLSAEPSGAPVWWQESGRPEANLDRPAHTVGGQPVLQTAQHVEAAGAPWRRFVHLAHRAAASRFPCRRRRRSPLRRVQVPVAADAGPWCRAPQPKRRRAPLASSRARHVVGLGRCVAEQAAPSRRTTPGSVPGRIVRWLHRRAGRPQPRPARGPPAAQHAQPSSSPPSEVDPRTHVHAPPRYGRQVYAEPSPSRPGSDLADREQAPVLPDGVAVSHPCHVVGDRARTVVRGAPPGVLSAAAAARFYGRSRTVRARCAATSRSSASPGSGGTDGRLQEELQRFGLGPAPARKTRPAAAQHERRRSMPAAASAIRRRDSASSGRPPGCLISPARTVSLIIRRSPMARGVRRARPARGARTAATVAELRQRQQARTQAVVDVVVVCSDRSVGQVG